MKIRLEPLVLNDEERRAIRERMGMAGLATREEIQRWAAGVLAGELATLMDMQGPS